MTSTCSQRWLWFPRLVMAAVFVLAGVLKIMRPDVFLEDVLNYRLLSREAAWVVTFYLPPLELIAGLALLHPRYCRAATWLLLACMLGFVAALLSAWLRGLDIECGCFGSLMPTTHYAWLLLRDAAFISMLVWILIKKSFHVVATTHQIPFSGGF